MMGVALALWVAPLSHAQMVPRDMVWTFDRLENIGGMAPAR
jgi:hypothetical protein